MGHNQGQLPVVENLDSDQISNLLALQSRLVTHTVVVVVPSKLAVPQVYLKSTFRFSAPTQEVLYRLRMMSVLQVKVRVRVDHTIDVVGLAVAMKEEACPCLLGFHVLQKMHSDVLYDLVRP